MLKTHCDMGNKPTFMPSPVACGDIFAIKNGRVFGALHILYGEGHSLHGHQQHTIATINHMRVTNWSWYRGRHRHRHKGRSSQRNRNKDTFKILAWTDTNVHVKYLGVNYNNWGQPAGCLPKCHIYFWVLFIYISSLTVASSVYRIQNTENENIPHRM